MDTFLVLVLDAVVLSILAYGVNCIAMHAAFVRGTPAVSGSAIFSDTSVSLYLQLDGYVHNASIVEVVMNKEQVNYCSAAPPKNFREVETQHPLCPIDRVTFQPFQSMPPRDLNQDVGVSFLSGSGHYILWCGCFPLHHGLPSILRIPCKRPLDESPQIGIRYRYRVGALMAEEYRGIETAEMGRMR